MITRMKVMAAVSLVALCGSAVSAEVYDPDARSGQVMQATQSVIAYGVGSAATVRYWVPIVIPAAESLLNNAVVQVVDGEILGAVSSHGTAGARVIWYFQTADQFDANGTYTSNNVVVDEGFDNHSNTLGQMLPDGRIVFRANFAGAAQNNLETVKGNVKSQLPSFPEPNAGDKILVGPGIDGVTGNAQLGVPAALPGVGGNIWVGNTNFSSTNPPDLPIGLNIWNYDGTPQNSQTPTYTYTQADAEAFANANGVNVNPGAGRQTQPAFASVNGFDYVMFGMNSSDLGGGSARPAMMIFDVFQDGDDFTGAIPLLAPAGTRFIDHQATGGGTGVFENKHFSMNSSGQFVAVTESIATIPTYSVLLYNPIFDGSGRITGFDVPITIADAGPTASVNDGLAVLVFDDGSGGVTVIPAISGVGINNAGNIAFTATWDTGEVDPDSGEPILSSAAYFYKASNSTLHQVLRQNDTVGNPSAGSQIQVGLIPQTGGDKFFATSLADNADVLAFPFRPAGGDARGVIVVAFGHIGDADFDGSVGHPDLASVLSHYGGTFGSPVYNPEVDFNCDGSIGHSDLAALLANYGN